MAHYEYIGYFKRGQYAKAELLIKQELKSELEGNVPNTFRCTHDRMVCLEQMGRIEDVPAMLDETVTMYAQELDSIREGIRHLQKMYTGRYGKHWMPSVISLEEEMAKTAAFLKQIVKEEPMEYAQETAVLVQGRLDPFSKAAGLPIEIIKLILDFCEDLLPACVVSHSWHGLVLSQSRLYRQAYFSSDVALADVSSYLETCRKYGIRALQRMEIRDVEYGQESPILKKVLQAGMDICQLDIGGSFLKFSELRHFCVETGVGFYCLRKLQLFFDPYTSHVRGLIACLPNLSELYLALLSTAAEIPDENIPRLFFKDLNVLDMRFHSNNYGEVPPNANIFLERCEFGRIGQLSIGIELSFETQRILLVRSRPDKIAFRGMPVNCLVLAALLDAANVKPKSLLIRELMGGVPPPLGPFDFNPPHDCLSRLEKFTFGFSSGGYLNGASWLNVCALLEGTNGNVMEFTLDNVEDLFSPESDFTFTSVFERCPRLEEFTISHCSGFDGEQCRKLGAALEIANSKLKVLKIFSWDLTESDILSLFHEDFSIPSTDIFLDVKHVSRDALVYLGKHCARVRLGDVCYEFDEAKR